MNGELNVKVIADAVLLGIGHHHGPPALLAACTREVIKEVQVPQIVTETVVKEVPVEVVVETTATPPPPSSVISARRGAASSSHPTGEWGELGDTVIATAILDRLLHHSHVLNIKEVRERQCPLNSWRDGSGSNLIR